MKELFSIGRVHVYYFGLMVAISIITVVFFVAWRVSKKGINEDIIFNLVIPYNFLYNSAINNKIVFLVD